MTIVIISTAVVENTDTGYRKVSKVYHPSEGPTCGRVPKPNSPHYKEVEEDIAIAFGRTLCGPCRQARERQDYLNEVTTLVEGVMGMGLGDLAAALPEHIELRILAHGRNKLPITLWTSRPEEDGPRKKSRAVIDPMFWSNPSKANASYP